MATTSTGLLNRALVFLRAERVTDIASDTSRQATEANAIYDDVRDTVLRMHKWNCATKRVILDAPSYSVGAADHTANTFTISSADYTNMFIPDMKFTVSGSTANDGDYTVTSSAFSTDTVITTDEDLTDSTAGGTISSLAPSSTWSYVYSLPSDFVRMASVKDLDDRWKIENRLFQCNLNEPTIIYVYQLTDVSEMDMLLQTAISARLAMELAQNLVGPDMVDKAAIWFQSALDEARFVDSMEAGIERVEGSEWADAHHGSTDYVTIRREQ